VIACETITPTSREGGRNTTWQLELCREGTSRQVLPNWKTPPLALEKLTVPVGALAPPDTTTVQVSENDANVSAHVTPVVVGAPEPPPPPPDLDLSASASAGEI
jgi:hypothetical protein